MDEKTELNQIVNTRAVLDIAGMHHVIVRRGIPYRPGDSGAHMLDVRYPAASLRRGRMPAIVFVTGYPDPAFEAMAGCKLKDMQSYVSWTELVAASDMVAVSYANTDPAADVRAVLGYLRDNGPALGIATDRIGIWSCSGNVPNALAVLTSAEGSNVGCAVFCYGFMFDAEGSAEVAEAAKTWGFVNPCAGKSVDDLPAGTRFFVARAGEDSFPGVNGSIDRFVSAALARNRAITVMNLPDAPHAFDLFYNTETSRHAIKCMLAFMRACLIG